MRFNRLPRYCKYFLRMLWFDLTGGIRHGQVAIGPRLHRDRRLRIELGAEVFIGPNAIFQGEGSVAIGNGTYIGAGFSCNAMQSIIIGEKCMLGNYVSVIDNDHGLDAGSDMITQPLRSRPVRIERNCWLGEKAIILAGVSIGAGAVVAAGAVVTRDVEPNAIVGGVPARLISSRARS